ncbi:MAG: hypothetical protein CBE00_02675 [Planctomycetaceae bacterium TMED240]|nr:hypothetical protein [Rhodopirellula sp.]OUX08086.1 MAG: hypothetical protein CBE00_02675 [Planctomycetaceae bacterium TMED240]
MRNLLAVVCMLSFAPFVVGDPPSQAFDSFSSPERAYFKRVHGQLGALAYTPKYPGGFEAWQGAARAKLKELIGIDRIAAQVSGHQPVVHLEQEKLVAGYRQQLARIATEPGVSIPFWILRPLGSEHKKLPVVICAHGHDADGWNTYAGVYEDKQHQASTEKKQGDPGVQAVRQGYIAIVPATRGLAASTSISDPNGRHGNRTCRAQLMHCLLAGRTAIGERVWDTTCLLDWIVSDLSGADADRVGMLGNSGGGVLTVYVAALDERIAVAHPSCSLTSFASEAGYIFHCDCCMVPGIKTELADMPDIAALAIPRKLVVVHGLKDGLHSTATVNQAMARLKYIFSQHSIPDNFVFRWQPDGHRFYPSVFWPVLKTVLRPDR